MKALKMASRNSDMNPKIMVGIRNEARSSVYRAALSTRTGCCYGFLLGRTAPSESPTIEVSLISALPNCIDNLFNAPRILAAQIASAKHAADFSEMSVIGVFLAWESIGASNQNQIFGLMVDSAVNMKLSFIAHFSTDGHETLWKPSIFAAKCFPSDPLEYRNTRGKLSTEPHHNSRRIHALWNKLLKEHHGTRS